MTDITLDGNGNVCPSKSNKILLVDADTIIFASCSVLAYREELLGREFYSDDEWDIIIGDPGYDEGTNTLGYLPVDEAFEHSMDKINSIMDRTGCSDFELHFTIGRDSFPYEVSPHYKVDRVSPDNLPPYGIYLLKTIFKERFPDKVHMNTKWEADHIVVCKKRDFPYMYILTSVDKDVLYTLPTNKNGKHFNYYSSTRYGIDMKWVEVTEEEAVKRYYIQTLTGDKGDGVIGLYGIGPSKAEKALNGCKTELEMWEKVLDMYRKHNRDEIDAIINMRLVNMKQMVLTSGDYSNSEYKVALWYPPTKDKGEKYGK